MKTAKLGDYFLWRGEIVQVKWINEGKKSIGFIVKRPCVCGNCGHVTEVEHQADIIESSPLFQDEAQKIESISE